MQQQQHQLKLNCFDIQRKHYFIERKGKYFFDIKLHRNKSEKTRFSSTAIKIKLFLFIIKTLAFSH